MVFKQYSFRHSNVQINLLGWFYECNVVVEEGLKYKRMWRESLSGVSSSTVFDKAMYSMVVVEELKWAFKLYSEAEVGLQLYSLRQNNVQDGFIN